ncbi:MAG: aminopeptidase P family protein [Candidatus Tectomicrobia bacterium]|nr:aminopeptidase P family protein [Candidatus Tectomicrobia bacterium]
METNHHQEYGKRLQQTRRAMTTHEFDLLFVYGSGKRDMLRMDGIRYLVGLPMVADHALLRLEHDGAPTLYLSPPSVAAYAQAQTTLCNVLGVNDVVERAAAELRERKSPARRIGFIGRAVMPGAMFASLAAALPGEVCVEENLLQEIGKQKSAWEIECVKRAQEVADHGFAHLRNVARPGMREFELAAELERLLRMEGASDNFGLVAASPHHQAIHPPTARKLEAGDILISELSPECEGYFAQLCRTLVLGPPIARLRGRYEVLKAAFDAGLAAAKPGAFAAEVAESINAVLREAGYGEFCKPPYMRSRGHGLGQGSCLPGELEVQNKVELAEGMTFVLHPNQYLPETGYMMLGETCVVTSTGGVSLSSVERTLFAIDF